MTVQDQAKRPRIQYGEMRKHLNPLHRKYGRQDIRAHYDLSRDVSMGNAEIGGVFVDCRFLLSKTQLGVFEKDDPGGIIYMDLTIDQPVEWRLRQANISVILEVQKPSTPREQQIHEAHVNSLEMKHEYYGPKLLVGPELTAESSKNYSIGPYLEGAGIGASIGEFGSSVTVPRTSWWSFHGTPKPPKGSSDLYTTLNWTMSQNTLAYSTEHPAKIQTAFAFSHSYKPFTLRVEIDGKLRHLHHQFKDKAIGLFTKTRREKPISLLFNFERGKMFESEILEQAMRLDKEMTDLACDFKRIEVNPRASSGNMAEAADASKMNGQHNIPNTEQDKNSLPNPNPSVLANDSSTLPISEDLMARLQQAHNVFTEETSQQPEKESIPSMGVKAPPVQTMLPQPSTGLAPAPMKDVTPEQMAEAMEQMPAIICWLIALLCSIWRKDAAMRQKISTSNNQM